MMQKQREAATSTWLLNAMPRALQGGRLPWGAEDGNNTQKILPSAPALYGLVLLPHQSSGLLPLFSRLKARPHPHGSPPLAAAAPRGRVCLSPDICPPSIPPLYTPGNLGDFSQFSFQTHNQQFLTQAHHGDLCGLSSLSATCPPPLQPYSTAHCSCRQCADVRLGPLHRPTANRSALLSTVNKSHSPPKTQPGPASLRAFPPPLAPCAPPVLPPSAPGGFCYKGCLS